jgi:hypothetical protein
MEVFQMEVLNDFANSDSHLWKLWFAVFLSSACDCDAAFIDVCIENNHFIQLFSIIENGTFNESETAVIVFTKMSKLMSSSQFTFVDSQVPIVQLLTPFLDPFEKENFKNLIEALQYLNSLNERSEISQIINQTIHSEF